MPSSDTADPPEPTTPALHPEGPLSPLDRFNAAPAGAAEEALLACCGSRRWARRVAARRPYPDLEALLRAADEASRRLTAADLDEALADEKRAVTADELRRAARSRLTHLAARRRRTPQMPDQFTSAL
ncbi:hypothetical protein LRS74_19620 [Streptomyces sp. LX-29]|uniref:2-oxo-4-hydroxy-4-carboxy-5-ureidoimidazoline decarboxylase n=1 Tax=Streptomyces sp. LX-29 TaxID=2900152 RepID=UPI00240D5923|nr:2-oxo-4-hydroxy-4-carboxy-5-ureidoimidazoline decarboxylase [Streptomyces sp. LX-29]WFB09004.1 hypothetical protein LRS74_19620 [Streptomyces sp. LX-29]